jgi:hypothetical protein
VIYYYGCTAKEYCLTIDQRIPQILSLSIICFIFFMMAAKATGDITALIQNNPNDF